jgi:hypothetical protein
MVDILLSQSGTESCSGRAWAVVALLGVAAWAWPKICLACVHVCGDARATCVRVVVCDSSVCVWRCIQEALMPQGKM